MQITQADSKLIYRNVVETEDNGFTYVRSEEEQYELLRIGGDMMEGGGHNRILQIF